MSSTSAVTPVTALGSSSDLPRRRSSYGETIEEKDLRTELTKGGISSVIIDKLEEAGLEFAQLGEINDHGWARLDLLLGDEYRLKAWYNQYKDDLFFSHIDPYPPSLKKNVISWVMGIILAAPPLIIGHLKDIDIDSGDVSNANMNMRVLLPGCLILFGMYILTTQLRTILGQDMVQEKSGSVNINESQANVLTNIGVVGALFLTMVLALVQADPPLEDAGRFICQYYQIFNIISMFLCFLSTMMSALLLNYISPLDAGAGFIYFKNFMDYFGEPAVCILCAVLFFLYSIILWIFGRYGFQCGDIASLATCFCIQRLCLTQSYCSAWVNPLIEASDRKKNVQFFT
jgi:hypothetical protein